MTRSVIPTSTSDPGKSGTQSFPWAGLLGGAALAVIAVLGLRHLLQTHPTLLIVATVCLLCAAYWAIVDRNRVANERDDAQNRAAAFRDAWRSSRESNDWYWQRFGEAQRECMFLRAWLRATPGSVAVSEQAIKAELDKEQDEIHTKVRPVIDACNAQAHSRRKGSGLNRRGSRQGGADPNRPTLPTGGTSKIGQERANRQGPMQQAIWLPFLLLPDPSLQSAEYMEKGLAIQVRDTLHPYTRVLSESSPSVSVQPAASKGSVHVIAAGVGAGSFAVLLFLALIGIGLRNIWTQIQRVRAREAAQEESQFREVQIFARAYAATNPDVLDPLRAATLRGPSHALAEDVLDLVDDAPGPLLGHVVWAAGREPVWPYMARLHARRGGDASAAVGTSTLPVRLPPSIRDRHTYVIGKSGSGKTTLLRRLIMHDIAAGEGVCVLAPEAELIIDEVLPFVPRRRLTDVIYFNPADTDRPVPLNPLFVSPGEDVDRKVDETLAVLSRAFGSDSPAPRMEMILRQVVSSLPLIDSATLLDIPRLLDRADDSFRRSVIAQLDREELRRFWSSTYLSYPKDAHLPILNRLGRFLQPRVMRAMLGQSGCLDFGAAMDSGKIVLVNLSDGLLGPGNAELLGGLIVSQLQLAAMRRAEVSKNERRPFGVYLDEFQTFAGTNSRAYELILSRARKYGLRLTLAHQQTGQLPDSLLREVLGNVATIVALRVGAQDAARLGKELGIGSSRVQDLQTLDVGEACCRIDRTSLTIRTLPPPTGGSAAIREEAIRRSRIRYGIPATRRRDTTAARVASFDDVDPGEVFG